jgi:hypothetical protein
LKIFKFIKFSKTHQAWKTFLNQTPERIELKTNEKFNYSIDSGDNGKLPLLNGIGVDYFQRPQAALRLIFHLKKLKIIKIHNVLNS